MSAFNGRKIKAEIYGSSRGEKIGVKVSGLEGFSFDEEALREFLKRRSPSSSAFSTERKESDFPIFSGVTNGKITDELVCEIKNEDVKKDDGRFYGIPRPSHADYARYLKNGELDFSGGGEFSGRMTAPVCVLGGICKQILREKFGVTIYSYLTRVGKIVGAGYYDGAAIESLSKGGFPAASRKEEMLGEIERAAAEGDSVGAEAECVIKGMPKGIGGALFGGLEGKIAYAVYAIPAVKSVEFGAGSRFAELSGSEANDGLRFDENGRVIFKTNYSGGINGGITNGEDVVIRAAFRPVPTIRKKQETVDLVNKKNAEVSFGGRNDVCLGVRALPALESAAAIAVLDEIL